jgi:hypothetical protein
LQQCSFGLDIPLFSSPSRTEVFCPRLKKLSSIAANRKLPNGETRLLSFVGGGGAAGMQLRARFVPTALLAVLGTALALHCPVCF